MRKLFLALSLASVSMLTACGSSGGSKTPVGVGTGTFTNASLKGQYVYQVGGVDLTNGNAAYREGGVFTADGNGNITGGTDDFNEGSNGLITAETTGTYAISADGTGTLTINASGGSENFAITLANSAKLYLIEADTFANASGTAEQQSSSVSLTSAPSGTFSFRMHTLSSVQGSSSMAGVFTVSGGVASGSDDVLRAAVLDNSTGAPLTFTGSFNAPTNGRGSGSITDSASVTTDFEYYVVDANNIRFLTIDTGIPGSGRAEAQTGGPFSAASFSGGYAFGSTGDDASSINGVNTVGSFVAGGDGTISSGAYDSVQDGNPVSNAAFTGSYTMASSGRAAVTLNASSTISQIYWMVNFSRAFFLTNDTTKVEDGTADLQQTGAFSASTLNGQYAFAMDGVEIGTAFIDRVGWIQFNGTSSVTWNEVVNSSGTAQTPGFLTGTYAVAGNGRATANVSNLSIGTNDLIFYLISGNSGYVLQSDTGVQIIGSMTKQ